MPPTWNEVEVGALVTIAWMLRRQKSTLTAFMRRLYRRRPGLFFIVLGCSFGWLVQHILEDSDKSP